MSVQVLLRLVVCTTLVVGAIVFTLTVHSPSIQAAAGSEGHAGAAALMPIGKPVKIKAPLGLPPVPIPSDNPPTEDTIVLGRRLYYDPGLSVDGTVSCATCHAPNLGFRDGKALSNGVGGQLGTRKGEVGAENNSTTVTMFPAYFVRFAGSLVSRRKGWRLT